MTLIVAACDKPEAKPPTNIEKDDKSTDDTDIVPKGKSGSGSSGEKNTDGGEPADGDADKTGGESGGERVTPPPYSFAFDTASHKIVFTAGTYTKAVGETNKPTGDARAIKYTSSSTAIATVDNEGVVTFVTQGTVTITATKAAEGDHEKATASYELTITKMKPANKQALVDEITRAMNEHGNEVDLNYIDTSDITDMSNLFRANATFNGSIDKWDTSSVTTMRQMFYGATVFNQSLNNWNVAKVTNMSGMFFLASAFNQPLNNWNVAEVTNMDGMFAYATSFNQDISGWVDKSGRIIRQMFETATAMQTSNRPSWAP